MARIKKIVLGVVLCGAAWLGYAIWKGDRYSAGYATIAKEDSEARVVKLIGVPERITEAPVMIAWGTEDSIRKNDGKCVRVLWYSPPFPLNLDGGAWTIGLDQQAKVVSKYHYASP